MGLFIFVVALQNDTFVCDPKVIYKLKLPLRYLEIYYEIKTECYNGNDSVVRYCSALSQHKLLLAIKHAIPLNSMPDY